jgi:hypothetical protein
VNSPLHANRNALEVRPEKRSTDRSELGHPQSLRKISKPKTGIKLRKNAGDAVLSCMPGLVNTSFEAKFVA